MILSKHLAACDKAAEVHFIQPHVIEAMRILSLTKFESSVIVSNWKLRWLRDAALREDDGISLRQTAASDW